MPVTPVTKSYEKRDGELKKIRLSDSVRETGSRIGSRTGVSVAVVNRRSCCSSRRFVIGTDANYSTVPHSHLCK